MDRQDIDILNIDKEIHTEFEKEYNKLGSYILKIEELHKSLDSNNLTNRKRNKLYLLCIDLEKCIENINSRTLLNFYITETETILESYREILKKPVKVNFMGKSNKINSLKKRIINEYLEIAKKYYNIYNGVQSHPILSDFVDLADTGREDLNLTENSTDTIITSCNNCSNTKNFEIIENNTYICLECFSQQDVMIYSTSYKDIDRINIYTKYTYDRKVHFRDCFNQYQGKQNCTINDEIYKNLEIQFENHHILIGNKNTSKNERFRNVTKEHIIIFLKELGYTKHYENINLIHYNLTGIKPDDISYLEDVLLQDFDKLTEIYDKIFKHELKIERKNFINTQYVLYQLLRRHHHNCSKEDFSILKTIDRKAFHDDICQNLFTRLGWNIDLYF